jgi:CDP-4-dehydro-6-deoxyglucose reductase
LYDFSSNLTPSGRQFSCDADETVLCRFAQGIILPYGCKNGACGSCKGKVTMALSCTAIISNAPSAKRSREGMSLFCCAKPQSDIDVEVREMVASR